MSSANLSGNELAKFVGCAIRVRFIDGTKMGNPKRVMVQRYTNRGDCIEYNQGMNDHIRLVPTKTTANTVRGYFPDEPERVILISFKHYSPAP